MKGVFEVGRDEGVEMEEGLVSGGGEGHPAKSNTETMDVAVVVGTIEARQRARTLAEMKELKRHCTHVSTARISRLIENWSTHAALLMPSMSILQSSSIALGSFCKGRSELRGIKEDASERQQDSPCRADGLRTVCPYLLVFRPSHRASP